MSRGGSQRAIGNSEKTTLVGRQPSKLPTMDDRSLVHRRGNYPLLTFDLGVPGVFPGQTTGQPCKERRGEKHGRRGGGDEGALVRAEDTIYGHLVGEKEDRRGYEEHRGVSSSVEEGGWPLGGWHVPRKDFSTGGGQRFGGRPSVVRGGAMLQRGGEVMQEWR